MILWHYTLVCKAPRLTARITQVAVSTGRSYGTTIWPVMVIV